MEENKTEEKTALDESMVTAIVERVAEKLKPEAPPVIVSPPAETKEPNKFDYATFLQTFTQDPIEGLNYADRVRFGVDDPVSLIQGLTGAVVNLAGRMLVQDTERFLENHPEYEPTPKNQQVLEGILQENGWDWSYSTLSNAFILAVQRGLIEPQEVVEEPEPVESAPMPRMGGVRGGGGESSPEVEELEKLSTAELEKKMAELGMFGGGKKK
jgi:hypothetical protein